MSVTRLNEKIVVGRSGGFCSFPGCATALVNQSTKVSSGAVLGEIVHIAGEHLGSARHDPNMSDAERNASENLTFMCPNHHTEIDKSEDKYPADVVRKWKADHEGKVERTLHRELADLNFAELSLVCDGFVQHGLDNEFTGSLVLTAIQEKIDKNGLQAVEEDLKLGLSRVAVVRAFINERVKIDGAFAEKLKFGFKRIYAEYRYQGLDSVETYLELVAYARRYSNGNAAPLAVVYALLQNA